MPTITTAAPTSTIGSRRDNAPIAITGSPNAVISGHQDPPGTWIGAGGRSGSASMGAWRSVCRSEEHTSELQSRLHLVCRLLLEKKKLSDSTPRVGRRNNPPFPEQLAVAATSDGRLL